MTEHNNRIEQQVMASVAVIYTARKLTGITALKFYVLGLSGAGIISLVSVSNVAENFINVAQGGLESIVGYTVAAVLGTTLLVQFSLVAGVLALVSLLAPAIFGRSRRAFA